MKKSLKNKSNFQFYVCMEEIMEEVREIQIFFHESGHSWKRVGQKDRGGEGRAKGENEGSLFF